jgi:hypothetical protein
MPKKPTKTDTDETTKAGETAKTKEKGGKTFLKVDRSMRPSGFHCDELNNGTNPEYADAN